MISPTVITSESLRRVETHGQIYLPDIVRQIRERYGFVQAPTTVADLMPPDENTPLMFKHGRFLRDGKMIVVDSLRLHRHLVTVDTSGTTDDSDAFLDDLFGASNGVYGPAAGHPRMYASAIEFQSDVLVLDGPYNPLGALGITLTRMIKSYLPADSEGWPHGFLTQSIALTIDPTKFVLPCPFTIERRVGQPFSNHVYYSQAPLRTQDHVAALEKFESEVEAATTPT